jgi:hypothetical protein
MISAANAAVETVAAIAAPARVFSRRFIEFLPDIQLISH